MPFRGAAVLVHSDENLGCYRVSYLAVLPDFHVPHWMEVRGKELCHVSSSDDSWAGGVLFAGVEGGFQRLVHSLL